MNTYLSLLLLATVTLTSECPTHAKIGNAINFVRLFKEQADSDWNYQNVSTSFALRYHYVEPKKGFSEKHRIVFELTDNNSPKRSWYYAIQVVYDENSILQRVEKFARLRVYENSRQPQLADMVNQLVIDNFFHHEPRVLDRD